MAKLRLACSIYMWESESALDLIEAGLDEEGFPFDRRKDKDKLSGAPKELGFEVISSSHLLMSAGSNRTRLPTHSLAWYAEKVCRRDPI
jgi:hypothetical protein